MRVRRLDYVHEDRPVVVRGERQGAEDGAEDHRQEIPAVMTLGAENERNRRDSEPEQTRVARCAQIVPRRPESAAAQRVQDPRLRVGGPAPEGPVRGRVLIVVGASVALVLALDLAADVLRYYEARFLS